MSSRQLRKLQKQRELQDLQARAAKEDASESEEEAPIHKPKPSLFSGFAALGDEEDQDEDEDEEPGPAQEEPERVEAPKPSAKKSKKKKKKAKKAVAAAATTLEESPKGDPPAKAASPGGDDNNDDVDEIDQAIRELNLKAQSRAGDGRAGAGGGSGAYDGSSPAAVAYERICELLRVNTHHLKVMNEMRNLFGREAIAAAQTEEQENEQGRAAAPRRRALQQNVDLETFLKGTPGRSLPEVTLRRNPFLPGKETWPRASTDGLTMRQVADATADTRCGAVEFSFAHDDHYNNLERQFFQLVQMYDPMQLVYFLHRHPYHVSSLIQVSKVAKQDQNSALAGDLCERALFTFGRVSLSAFRQKIEEGKARLEFLRPENRQFWLAGYHYLKSLTMKGTYRTALEWTKLLFSMDLSDPYGMIHFLHPMAIRAHESKWFIDFCDSEALDGCDTAQDYVRQTLVLARLQQKDTAGAKALATEGMERLPWLYSSLFKSLNLDVPKAIWGTEPRDAHETLFTELYIHQTKQLWDNPQTISLLKEAASLAQKPSLDSLPAAPAAGRNVGRFVYLDNTPALMALVPGGMLHGFPNWDFDPLPPTAEDNIFSYDSQRLPWNPDRGSDVRLNDLNLERLGGRNALQRMLQQMMQQGAPAELRQQLEEAMAQLEGGAAAEGEAGAAVDTNAQDDGSDTDGDREASPRQDGQQGLWQAFMDMVWPVRSSRQDDDDDNNEQDFDATPGAWPSDDDDMPVLIYEDIDADDSNGSGARGNYRQPHIDEDTDE